ncbi:hypothetical protein QBC35DRAFT_524652 [Podospora australis]|uniref:Rhodopsin domain-containing protein n=1 Tax=Podospora australis TaxID=1536484 RepID=A0AAN7AH94_9PEZI|nr:hypothetical protein QBC35DRAFT_524652 [Podospora australis]
MAMKDSEPDFRPVLNITIWILAASSGSFLGLRIWGKHQRGRKLWWDDGILIAAWICLLLSCILQSVDTHFGFGQRDADVTSQDILDMTRLVSVVAGFFLVLAAAWSKTSFALTLLRLTIPTKKCFSVRGMIWFAIWSTNLAIAASGVFQWAQCWPLDKLWRQWLPGQCLRLGIVNGYNMFVAAYSGLMDITLAMLPCKIFYPLRIQRDEKIGIVVAMGMGIFAGATSFMKIFAIYNINRIAAGPEHVVVLMILGTAESAITIMAVSMPVLRTLLMGRDKT